MRKTRVIAACAAAVATVVVAAPWSAQAAASGPDRIKASATRLYDGVTGATFTPRGANYVRLATSRHGVVFHSTFEPGLYNPADAQNVLDGLKNASGYNAVRVFIDPGDGNYDHGIDVGAGADGLNQSYLDNVADFVNRAAADGIYVLPALSDFPVSPYYQSIVSATDQNGPNPDVAGNNNWFMDKGYIAAKQAYAKNFVTGLKSRVGANISAVFGYELENEAFWDAAQKPFSTLSGTLIGPDGLSYDMSQPAQRQQAADASMVVWANAGAAGIRAGDPAALVTVGFFTNQAVDKSGFNGLMTYCSTACDSGVDYRVPGRPASIAKWSSVDFIDMHAYPQAGGYSIGTDLGTSEISLVSKPYLLGEFGAYKPAYGNDIVSAAYDMRDKQVDSCGVGNGAQGWLFWTYDTDVVNPDLANQGLFYSLADDGGAINGQLATVVRGNPCVR